MTDNTIKSALELALEKAQHISVPEEELEKDKYIEQGRKLAGEYLSGKTASFQETLKSASGKTGSYIKEGITSALMLNIVLPRTKDDIQDTRKVLEGIILIKKEKKSASQTAADLERQLQEYLKYIEENYKQLVQHFQAQSESTEGQAGVQTRASPAHNPAFQKNWKQIIHQIETQFGEILERYKHNLQDLP